MKIRTAPLLLSLFIALGLSASSFAQDVNANGHWVSAWGTSPLTPIRFLPIPPEQDIENSTVRMVVRPTIGGQRLRVRFSNEFGTAALKIGAAHVALTESGAKAKPGTDHVLTFGGNPEVTAPAGAPVISDPVDLPVKAFDEVSVSIFLPSKTPVSTWHSRSKHDTYIAGPGDLTAKSELLNPQVKPVWYFLSGVEMWEPASSTAVVALGDSITDGSANAMGYYDWPNQLAERLSADKARPAVSVINEGIGGNRILNDGAGVNALARFDRDVLSQTGVTDLIVLEGINDIGFPRAKFPAMKNAPAPAPSPFAAQKVSADEIIVGLRQIIARAHEHGIRVFGATMTPFGASTAYDDEGEAIRQAVNKWIRGKNEYDGIFDFDAVMRDTDHPVQLRAAYDSGDHIHPNPVGYKAMADAVDLSALRGTRK